MPAIGFIYPEGDTISFEDALDNNKLDINRMGVYPTALKEMAKQRDPDRKPSVTELLNGTCQAYLQRTKEYYIDPQSLAFSLAGTLHHKKLEDNASEEEAEIQLEGLDITGIVDLYDKDTKSLIDYKNTGSYKASQILGMEFFLEDDPSGEVYKRTGRWGRKGTPKKVKRYWANPEKADFGDWSWQINMYRYMLESTGHQVESMYVQMTVRDGGILAARDRGIEKNIYLVEVPYIHNDHLLDYFRDKRDRLLESLEKSITPEKCSKKETWDGMKCKKYCEVRYQCPHINNQDII
tara:strand:+ start:594 stop:1475 length:882 start_codon:yes stop_codon:yes gene_type:complete